MTLSVVDARSWLDRWDRQQEHYLPDREERFAVVADVVAAALGMPDPVVLDVGCGPGSLSARVHQRLPKAWLIGVDADPLLLELARVNHPWLMVVDQDLRSPQWMDKLPVGTVDAVVSTTALHWLRREELATLYDQLAGLLRPGGVFINCDHMPGGQELSVLNAVAEQLTDYQAQRAGVTDNEDWASWWSAVRQANELSELVAERAARSFEHEQDGEVGFEEQVELLRKAGFAEVGPVWQFGADRVLVGIR
jgi:trans-aconitate methyltransferase